MKNKFLVGILTFLCTLLIIIVFFNSNDSNTKKNYKLDRKYIGKNYGLNFENTFDQMCKSEYLMSTDSDKFLVEYDKNVIDDSNSKFTFYFDDLSKKSSYTLNLPSDIKLLYSSLNSIYFGKQFDFYECNLKNNINQIKFKDLKIINVIPINESGILLCLGEFFQNKKYNLGFFKVNKINGKVEICKVIEQNLTTKFPQSYLQYSGDFNSHEREKCFTYTCDKYSKVFFFDEHASFLKEFSTIDNSEIPDIITTVDGMNYYSRKNTYNTNEGLFIKNDEVFILSSFSEFSSKIIIDIYDFKNLKYKQSLKFDLDHFSSKNIRNILFKNDKLIIALDHNYASFIFSRHI